MGTTTITYIFALFSCLNSGDKASHLIPNIFHTICALKLCHETITNTVANTCMVQYWQADPCHKHNDKSNVLVLSSQFSLDVKRNAQNFATLSDQTEVHMS